MSAKDDVCSAALTWAALSDADSNDPDIQNALYLAEIDLKRAVDFLSLYGDPEKDGEKERPDDPGRNAARRLGNQPYVEV